LTFEAASAAIKRKAQRKEQSFFMKLAFNRAMYAWGGDRDAQGNAVEWFRRVELARMKLNNPSAILHFLEILGMYGQGASGPAVTAVADINVALIGEGKDAVSLPFFAEKIKMRHSSFTPLISGLVKISCARGLAGKADKIDLSILEDTLKGLHEDLMTTDKHILYLFEDVFEGMAGIDRVLIAFGMEPYYIKILEDFLQDMDVLLREIADIGSPLKLKGNAAYQIQREIVNPLLISWIKIENELLTAGKITTSRFTPENVLRRNKISEKVLDAIEEFINRAIERDDLGVALEWIAYIQKTVFFAKERISGWPDNAHDLIALLGRLNAKLVANDDEPVSVAEMKEWVSDPCLTYAACPALAEIDRALIEKGKTRSRYYILKIHLTGRSTIFSLLTRQSRANKAYKKHLLEVHVSNRYGLETER
jgi:hypothetical protein